MEYERIKRVGDIIVASIALVLLLPVLLITIIAIKIDSRGPSLFRQQRFGKDKKPFRIYKFRSMNTDAPINIPTNDFHNSHTHITRVGRIIRKLSIDELPQLINIIEGSMSLVGPRPVVLTEMQLTNERDKHGAHAVKPGITGWAQVNGRDDLSYREKAHLDGWYAKHVSFVLDVRCILYTFKVIFFQEGNREGHEHKRCDPSIMEDNNVVAS